MMLAEIVWENLESFGCEFARISQRSSAIHVESTVIFFNGNSPVQIDYFIDTDNLWATKKVLVQTKKGKNLEINATGTGKWFDQHGKELEELRGAIDVDLSVTPFSNSLPVNRYDWELNQRREFEMVYIDIPQFKLHKMKQTYTFIERKKGIRIFKYQSPNFEAFISFDESGFVIDYPELFSRRF